MHATNRLFPIFLMSGRLDKILAWRRWINRIIPFRLLINIEYIWAVDRFLALWLLKWAWQHTKINWLYAGISRICFAMYFIGSERLPSTYYILSEESSIPFYSTSNGYKNDWYKQSGKNPKIWHLSEPFQEADDEMRLGRKNICINVVSPKDLVDKHLYTYLFFLLSLRKMSLSKDQVNLCDSIRMSSIFA